MIRVREVSKYFEIEKDINIRKLEDKINERKDGIRGSATSRLKEGRAEKRVVKRD